MRIFSLTSLGNMWTAFYS